MDFLAKSLAIAEMELRKLLRDPMELFSRAVQPVLWLAIFGQVFSQVRGIPTGNVSYLAFMTPGILAQSVLFTAIFYGIAVIWERDLGVIHKLLVSPSPRGALVFGKAIASGARGLVQAVIIYLIAFAMHISIRTDPVAIVGVLACVVLGSAVFSTFSLIIACIVKTRERFMGIGQVLTMPLFFASNAIYPLSLMPAWLRAVAQGESADLSGRCLAHADDRRRARRAQLGRELLGAGWGVRGLRRDRGAALSDVDRVRAAPRQGVRTIGVID